MKVLNFGSCNLDYVYSLDHIVAPGETESSYGMQIFPGGKGLNQSIAAAKAGVEVYHAGCVGTDAELLLTTLRESGVDTRYLEQVQEKNGHAVIQVTKDGENSIFLFPGSNVMLTEEMIDRVLSDFGAGDLLLLQNETNLVSLILEKAHRKGMFTVFNPSPFDSRIGKKELENVSCLILNLVEAKGFSGSDDPENILAYFKAEYPDLMVMLTLGKKGCVYAHRDQKLCHPAFTVPTVDTTAAGDTFTGFFVAGLSKEMPVEDILKTASAASAIAVTRNGAAPSIPKMPEVMEFLENRI